MHHHSHSVQSAAIRRVFSAFIIASLLMAVLPYLAPPVAEAQETATYIAEKYNCQPGFDPSTTNVEGALAACQELATGVSFTLSTSNPDYPGDTRNTSSGQAVWSDVPLGTAYSVAESIPEGYGIPWVYCEVTGGPAADQFSYFQAPGGVMDVGLTDPSLTAYRPGVLPLVQRAAGRGRRATGRR